VNKIEKGIAHYIGAESLEVLQHVRIGIAGAGGLGSNCAAMLTRMGFRTFVVADFDTVSASNLNRQFFFEDQLGQPKVTALTENLRRINPDVQMTTFEVRLTAENIVSTFSGCDCLIEAFDDAACKAMFAETFLHDGRLVVMASGLAGWGNTDAQQIKKLRGNFYIVGDMKTAVSEAPPVASGVCIAAAKQADIVFSHFMNQTSERFQK
jgi:sulfur carrier protein ThiS adenylyltransferase